MVATCREQSTVAYWEQHLRQAVSAPLESSAPGRTPPRAGAAALPLVADPHQACAVLADTRDAQAEEAAAALSLVSAALDLLPAGSEDATEAR